MRPILHGDVANAARALLSVPSSHRKELCQRMIVQAERADRFVRKVGRMHPFWGNGSLMAVARRRPLVDDPGFDDPDYCQCFEMVLRGLIEWKARVAT